jgi:hypothetical protein
MYMWSNWEPETVDKELAALSANKVTVMRVFPLWSDFQPLTGDCFAGGRYRSYRFRDNKPLHWVRVHDLPDFVYFNHSIHIKKGVGCETCHGRVDQMPLMRRVASLDMQWCLGCHRDPAPYLREPGEVFDMQWRAPPDQAARAAALRERYALRSTRELTDCSTCHR